ncbi:MAG: type II secretion system F family protein [Tepidisphaeraceae bacterium]
MTPPDEFQVLASPQSTLTRGLAQVGWFLVGVALIGGLPLAFEFPFLNPGLILLPAVLAMLTVVAFGQVLQRARRKKAEAVLTHVAAAIALELPLSQYLNAAERDARGGVRRRLRRLLFKLETGSSLARALWATAGELPLTLQYRVAAAERAGTLPAALPRLMQQERQRASTHAQIRADRAYGLTLLLVFTLVFVIVCVFVIPKYSMLLRDFRLEPPLLVRWFVQSQWVGSVLMLLIVPLAVAVMALLARSARALIDSRPTFSIWRGLTQRLAWHAPVFGRLIRHREMAAVCDAMEQMLHHGVPLPDAIAWTALPMLNPVLRGRLLRWRQWILEGEATASAAQLSRLPRLFCDLLAGARSDMPGAVAFAGRAFGSASERLAIVLRSLLPVMITAFFAGLVLFLALSMFEPMVALIDALADKAVM